MYLSLFYIFLVHSRTYIKVFLLNHQKAWCVFFMEFEIDPLYIVGLINMAI